MNPLCLLEMILSNKLNYTDYDESKYVNGTTLLMRYALHTNNDITEAVFKLFIDENVNAQNDDGWTALMYAVRYSNDRSTEGTVNLLIDAGADVNATNVNGWTALMIAAGESNWTSTEAAVKMLIDARADTIGVLEKAHEDKHKILYKYITFQRKMAFGLGRLDTGSIVSTLPREICKVILDFVK